MIWLSAGALAAQAPTRPWPLASTLAAAIFAEIVQGSGGNAAKMSEARAAGQAYPASFVPG